MDELITLGWLVAERTPCSICWASWTVLEASWAEKAKKGINYHILSVITITLKWRENLVTLRDGLKLRMLENTKFDFV